MTTLAMQQAYQPLESYNANVFAFDFSGTGKSGGSAKEVSREAIVKDLDSVVNYIEANYSSNIHLYGNTGIGGMLAQYYAATTNKIKSFAQFACIRYKDTAGGMGYPYPIVKTLSFFLRHLPTMRIILKPPKYNGYRHEEDNAFYEDAAKKYPDIWKVNSKMLATLMECFIAKDSAVKNKVTVPTLFLRYCMTDIFLRNILMIIFNRWTVRKD